MDFVGDFEDAAAIFKATDNFNKIEKVIGGKQNSRGVIGFPTEKGLFMLPILNS